MEPYRASARRSLLVGFSLLLAAWLLVGGAVFAATALADPGPEFTVPTEKATEPATIPPADCPAMPVFGGPYEGEEEAAGELQQLRIESVETCRALGDRLDEVVEREWWLLTQLLGQQGLAQEDREYSERTELAENERNELLRELNNQFIPGPLKTELAGVDAENPLPVLGEFESGPVEIDPELMASIDAGAESTKEGLWFLIGLAVTLAGFAFYRQIKP